jgi:hypothetical protein
MSRKRVAGIIDTHANAISGGGGVAPHVVTALQCRFSPRQRDATPPVGAGSLRAENANEAARRPPRRRTRPSRGEPRTDDAVGLT